MQSSAWFYCFWKKYHGCELDSNQGRQLCILGEINNHYYNSEEEMEKFKIKQ